MKNCWIILRTGSAIPPRTGIHLFSPTEYAFAAKQFLLNLRKDIAVDRLVSETSANLLVAPSWGMKPDAFLALFRKISHS